MKFKLQSAHSITLKMNTYVLSIFDFVVVPELNWEALYIDGLIAELFDS